MTKKIGKAWLPEWLAYPMLLGLIAGLIATGVVLGLMVQLLCLLFQPWNARQVLQSAREDLTEVFHDLRN